MYALEIDHHRGGRCYAVNTAGITTSDIHHALHRSDRERLGDMARLLFKGLNPKVVEVPPKQP